MREVTDRCLAAIAASKLQLLRIQRSIDASRAQMNSTTGLIEDSRRLLAGLREVGDRAEVHYAEMSR